jgi:hypothetical protein
VDTLSSRMVSHEARNEAYASIIDFGYVSQVTEPTARSARRAEGVDLQQNAQHTRRDVDKLAKRLACVGQRRWQPL